MITFFLGTKNQTILSAVSAPQEKRFIYGDTFLYRKAKDGVFLRNHLVRQDRGFTRSEVSTETQANPYDNNL